MENEKGKSDIAKRYSKAILLCYLAFYLFFGVILLLKQPFGDPPDETARYLIPQYIAEHGRLPNGYDEEIRIGGYGFSYGFQPILPYIVQGGVIRLVSSFTQNGDVLLYAARSVNLFLGFLMAITVWKLSQKWFSDRRFGWLFAFLVTFWQENLFVHTYVNTDSCCMLSTAVMLYGLTRGLEDGFKPLSSVLTAVGIILCALSYYNAYGYILSCILLFTASYIRITAENGRRRFSFQTKEFLRKGSFLAGLVILGIGWWFIRNALLYDGDFLGLQARDHCASLYAVAELNPDTRVTWQNRGCSVFEMLSRSGFATSTLMSFIGVFGSMKIITSMWIYRFYKAFLLGTCLACACVPASQTRNVSLLYREKKAFGIFYHCNMLFCILMPLFLSIVYSYTKEFQAQGRYVLPALIPLCYYCVHGAEKLCKWKAVRRLWGADAEADKGNKYETALSCLTAGLCILIVVFLAWTIFDYVLPYYAPNAG